jgi:thymidine kinase
MSLSLILGPMFSGKSSELRRCVDRWRLAVEFGGKKDTKTTAATFLYIRPSIDNRYGSNVVTHSGISDKDVTFLDDLSTIPKLAVYKQLVCIFIDEIQFYNNTLPIILQFIADGIEVTCAGLDAYANQKMWPEISALFPFATKLVKLTSVCMKCGSDSATLTIEKAQDSHAPQAPQAHQEEDTKETPKIKIGHANIYQSICILCFVQNREGAEKGAKKKDNEK